MAVLSEDGCAEIRHDGGTQIVVLADWIALLNVARLIWDVVASQGRLMPTGEGSRDQRS